MIRSRRSSWFTALALVALAARTEASGPRPQASTVPKVIALVGSHSGVPDAAGRFTVVARDLANNPVNGAAIVIDLSNATDLVLCADQLDADALVNCAAKTVRKFTDVTGSVTFTLLGGSNGAGNATTILSGARVFGDGFPLGSPAVAAYDLDGASGVGANDLMVWLTDFGSGEPWGRSDYDGSGGIGANDLSFWLSEFASSGSAVSCAAACP